MSQELRCHLIRKLSINIDKKCKPLIIHVIVAANTLALESPTPTPRNIACVARLFIMLEENA